MHTKLVKKYREGQTGWDDKNWSKEDKIKQIVEHAMKGDFVDVANIAMFAWNQEQPDVEDCHSVDLCNRCGILQ